MRRQELKRHRSFHNSRRLNKAVAEAGDSVIEVVSSSCAADEAARAGFNAEVRLIARKRKNRVMKALSRLMVNQ
jgi:hypothetical protein